VTLTNIPAHHVRATAVIHARVLAKDQEHAAWSGFSHLTPDTTGSKRHPCHRKAVVAVGHQIFEIAYDLGSVPVSLVTTLVFE
jgi:hypothetical protein